MFRKIRIFILLFILATVGLGAWRAKATATEWKYPLRVVIYPINGDGSRASKTYIDQLEAGTFKPVEEFISEEAQRYGIRPRYGLPVQIDLGSRVDKVPPEPPYGGNVLQIALWSLKLRYWVWRVDTYRGPAPQVRIFVIYHDPATHDRLAHSLGLEKGMIGVVNAFATRQMAAENNVIVAHEMLHTVGASDKYDPSSNQPLYPDGYAEPDLDPRYPQNFAEIMGGRVPKAADAAEIPAGLHQALVGEKTAREINWVR